MAPELSGQVLDDGDRGVQVGSSLALPLEVLERNLTSHAAHIAAAEAQWLLWLGEYCVREGWGNWGCSGPVQWLSWRCGMSPTTAREKVRIAMALRELPVIARRFGEGRLSYSKVRAITTINDALGLHPDMTRAGLIESRGGWQAMASDAIVALINGTARTDTVQPADTEVIITENTNTPAEAPTNTPTPNTPAEAVEYQRDGRALAPTVGERLTCDPRISVLIEDARGTVLGSGHKTRIISRRLRRALQRSDNGHCQFPGCAAHKQLHAHHIVHWTNGGPTNLDNLILVCHFHHHVLHEGGWNINPTTRAFTKPDGTSVDPNPTKHSRGSATEVTGTRTFNGPAPLGEAENEPFDLGLVLEGLAFNNEESQRRAEAATARGKERRWAQSSYGPPTPNALIKQRELEAHYARRPDDALLGI